MLETKTWDALNKKYGRQATSPDQDKLGQLVFYLLLYAERAAVAKKALLTLSGSKPGIFAGWLEVRVSRVREIADVLQECGVRRPFLAATAIKTLLTSVWQRFDDMTLEIKDLLEQTEVDYTTEMEQFSEEIQWTQVKAYIQCLWGHRRHMPADAHATRILTRLGIFKPKMKKGEKRKLLARVFGKENSLHRHHLLVMLGKMTCTEENPKCSRCPLETSCGYLK